MASASPVFFVSAYRFGSSAPIAGIHFWAFGQKNWLKIEKKLK